MTSYDSDKAVTERYNHRRRRIGQHHSMIHHNSSQEDIDLMKEAQKHAVAKEFGITLPSSLSSSSAVGQGRRASTGGAATDLSKNKEAQKHAIAKQFGITLPSSSLLSSAVGQGRRASTGGGAPVGGAAGSCRTRSLPIRHVPRANNGGIGALAEELHRLKTVSFPSYNSRISQLHSIPTRENTNAAMSPSLVPRSITIMTTIDYDHDLYKTGDQKNNAAGGFAPSSS